MLGVLAYVILGVPKSWCIFVSFFKSTKGCRPVENGDRVSDWPTLPVSGGFGCSVEIFVWVRRFHIRISMVGVYQFVAFSSQRARCDQVTIDQLVKTGPEKGRESFHSYPTCGRLWLVGFKVDVTREMGTFVSPKLV